MTNPSEPARGPHDEPVPVPPAPPLYKPAAAAVVIAVLPWILGGALAFFKPFKGHDGDVADVVLGVLIFVLMGSPVVALVLAGLSLRWLRKMDEDERPPGLRLALVARGISLGTIIAAFLYACFGMTVMRGRQLRRRGKARFAALDDGAGWSTPVTRTARAGGVEVPAELASEVAAAWRHNALTEHASVAAFSHVALDLIAVGAPAELVRPCHEDALDEIAHTELCFDIARAIDGVARAPGAFPVAGERPAAAARADAVARIAVEALVEGALLEGAAAHAAAALAQRARHPTIRQALATIAADEKRHAEHGWRVVDWCLASGGAEVAHALAHALDALPRTVVDGPMADGAGEPFGIAGRATLRAAFDRSRAEVSGRLGAALPSSRAA